MVCVEFGLGVYVSGCFAVWSVGALVVVFVGWFGWVLVVY